MTNRDSQLEAIAVVARGLGELADEVAFVGGAAVSVYIDDPGAQDVRATRDIDCVIELAGIGELSTLEAQLRCLGFSHATGEGDPICRWHFSGLVVDMMPTDGSILGFSNRWYPEAMLHLRRETVATGVEVSLFALPYFIGSKLEAFNTRGKRDWWASHDLEDIIAVLDGCTTAAEELTGAEGEIGAYLRTELGRLAGHVDATEIITAHIAPEPTTHARVARLEQMLGRLLAGR